MATALLFAVVCWTAVLWSRIDAAARIDDAGSGVGAPADAVIVLGCRVLPGGVPSTALRARTEHGIQVWRTTGSRYLLFTGGAVSDPTPEAVVMSRLALQLGVPRSAIVLEETARNTHGNARACARIARERRWRHLIIVSDPWHLYRARALFHDAGVTTVRQSPAFSSPTWTNPVARCYWTLRECAALALSSLRVGGG